MTMTYGVSIEAAGRTAMDAHMAYSLLVAEGIDSKHSMLIQSNLSRPHDFAVGALSCHPEVR